MKVLLTVLLLSTTLSAQAETESHKAYPRYAYSYRIDDFGSEVHHGKVEERDGDVVQGQYSYLDPAGTTRTVTYHADENGFRAIIDEQPGNIVQISPGTVGLAKNAASALKTGPVGVASGANTPDSGILLQRIAPSVAKAAVQIAPPGALTNAGASTSQGVFRTRAEDDTLDSIVVSAASPSPPAALPESSPPVVGTTVRPAEAIHVVPVQPPPPSPTALLLPPLRASHQIQEALPTEQAVLLLPTAGFRAPQHQLVASALQPLAHQVLVQKPLLQQTLVRQQPLLQQTLVRQQQPLLQQTLVRQQQPLLQQTLVRQQQPVLQQTLVRQQQPLVHQQQPLFRNKVQAHLRQFEGQFQQPLVMSAQRAFSLYPVLRSQLASYHLTQDSPVVFVNAACTRK